MKQLRDYQRQSIDALYRYWNEGNEGYALISAPTGSGKSLIAAYLVKELVEDYQARILVLTHIRELISQNHAEMMGLWPEAPAGIYSAGLKKREIEAQVLFAGIQSIDKHIHKLSPVPNIVIIDEAHLLSRDDTTRYKKSVDLLRQMNPKVKIVGLTATPFRLDSGWLHKGKDAFFSDIVYEIQVQGLIDSGYLSPITTKSGKVTISTDGVKKIGKEWAAGALEAKAMEEGITEAAVAEIVDRGKDRRKWLVFACGMGHARQIAECLESHGVPVAVVTGDTPSRERFDILDRFRRRELRCLVNINVLSTGFNDPEIDLLAMLRPSESASFYVQAVGRGMRIAPGKSDCLVLDFAGIVLRHGPIDAVNPDYKPGPGDGLAPAKECPNCQSIIHAAYRECPDCGFVFPPPAIKISHRPTEAPILKIQIEPTEWEVDSTTYRVHRKEGKADMVRVVYSCGIQSVSEFLFPESGSPRGAYFYGQWCKSIGLEWPYPRTAEQFCNEVTRQASRIWTMPDGKFKKVVRREYV